jgi:hypothetical protein
MNHTTLRFPRTMRLSGTAYAASIERTRRRDTSGWTIVAIVCFVLVLSWVLS